MKKLSIILLFALVAMVSCTKSKKVHPEIGDGNDELLTVGINNISVKYIRNDIANLQEVVFHYSITDVQQFYAAEMTKTSDCFVLTLNDLQSDTLYSYYYELFPYNGNSFNTNQKTFRTQSNDTPAPPTPPTPPSDVPEGAINGLFTINENGDQVYFSQGNLQYKASTNTWRFAENQWDYVGGTENGVEYGNVYVNGVKCDNALISPTYNGWIDLFGWGTSGYNHGAVCYQPWSTLEGTEDYFAYGDVINNLYDNNGQADWGYNSISNGGNTENTGWRALRNDEWVYLFNTRNTVSGIRFAKAEVDGIYGILLLPDNWNINTYCLNNPNEGDLDYTANPIGLSEWTNILEANGVVFLPISGHRIGTIVYTPNNTGNYWSSTTGGWNVHHIWFGDNLYLFDICSHHNGLSVRLVQDAQ